MEKFVWENFYHELADKVLLLKNDRHRLLEIAKNGYTNLGLPFIYNWNGHDFQFMDPFTFFGTINRGIKWDNKINLLRYYKQVFELKSIVPEDFSGIPVFNNMQSWLSCDEEIERADTLWELFETAIHYSENTDELIKNRFIDLYNRAISMNKISYNITMGLFWIRSESFVNLDSNNRHKLVNMGLCNNYLPKGEEYLKLCEKLKSLLGTPEFPYNSFSEFSDSAYPVPSSIKEPEDPRETHYWMYSAGPNSEKWEEYYDKGIMGIGFGDIGDLTSYNSQNDIVNALKEKYDIKGSAKNNSLALKQFSKDMKIGDVIFVKRGNSEIIGRGIVDSDYYYKKQDNNDYPHFRKVKWINKGSWGHPWGKIILKTLTDVTKYTDYCKRLTSIFDEDEPVDPVDTDITYPKYNKQQFLNEVFISEGQYKVLTDILEMKKNIIIEGAPGVGKTFAATRLAYSIIGEKDIDRVMMIQFHQSYSYEDFIEGLKPSLDSQSFELRRGVFLDFCEKASEDEDNKYFFIIDEINRGNISKIFGELFMLIEKDKRGKELRLLYSGDKFSVPKNVYIIGLMNTADRSLAMIDYALRRRFSFYEMKPAFDSDGFKAYLDSFDSQAFNNLISNVKGLNEDIASDESLGEGFMIGHSYFCSLTYVDEDVLSNIIEYELIPLLKEYWFDNNSKVMTWSDRLRRSIR